MIIDVEGLKAAPVGSVVVFGGYDAAQQVAEGEWYWADDVSARYTTSELGDYLPGLLVWTPGDPR